MDQVLKAFPECVISTDYKAYFPLDEKFFYSNGHAQ